jgi:hypothetical protein
MWALIADNLGSYDYRRKGVNALPGESKACVIEKSHLQQIP